MEEITFEDDTSICPQDAKWHWKPLPPEADIAAMMAARAPKPKHRKLRLALILGAIVLALATAAVILFTVALPAKEFKDMTETYTAAVSDMESGDYSAAYTALTDPALKNYSRIGEIDTAGRIDLIAEVEGVNWSNGQYVTVMNKVKALSATDAALQKLIYHQYPIMEAHILMHNGSYTAAYDAFVKIQKSGERSSNPVVAAVAMTEGTDWDDRAYHNISKLLGTVSMLEEKALSMFTNKFEFIDTALSLNGRWVYSGLGIDTEDDHYITAFESGYWIYTFNNGTVTELYNFKDTYHHDIFVRLNSNDNYLLYIGSEVPTSSNYMGLSPSDTDPDFMGILDVNSYYSWVLGFNRE